MKNIAIIALVAAAGAASANTLSASNTAFQSANPTINLGSPTGSSFGLSIFVGGDNGGGGGSGGIATVFSGIAPSFGTTASFSPEAGVAGFAPASLEVSSSVTPLGGNDFRIIVDAIGRDVAGAPQAFLAPGVAFGGGTVPINSIGVDLGDIFNSPSFPLPTDAVDFGDSVSILAESLELFDSLGSVGAFAGAGAGTPGFGGGITDYSDQQFISIAAGSDLFGTFDIFQATFTIDYRVIPAPASAGLLGLGGLAAFRRRR